MIRQRLGKDLLFFDGGMGTLLQEKARAGRITGDVESDTFGRNIQDTQAIYRSRKRYHFDEYILVANALKFHDDSCSLEEIIKAAVSHVKKAEREALLQTGDERKIYTALDVGPTGKLLKPMGDLEFERHMKLLRK